MEIMKFNKVIKKKFISLSSPNISGNEWKYVKECLDTDWVSSAGKFVNQFEEKISQYTKSKYSIACVNGTSALHIALLTIGVKDDHEVIVPTITFIAPINAVKYCNANPIFMDVDNDFCIDQQKTINFIKNETVFKNGFTYNKLTKRKITAIIIAHLFGRSMILDEIVKVCKKRNIKIVEDASEGLGNFFSIGRYKSKHVGTIGDVGCLSFNGNKIITAGGGGMILTNSKKIYEKSIYLTTQAKDDGKLFIHNDIGYNYRLSNVHAAIGLAQLENIDKVIRKKRKIYNYYKKKINNKKNVELFTIREVATSNYWLNIISLKKNLDNIKMKKLIKKFEINGIEVRPIWKPNHLQKKYSKYQRYLIDNALNITSSCLCIPSDLKLIKNDMDKVIDLL